MNINIELSESQAFRLLCESLDMEYVFDEINQYIVKKNNDGEMAVYIIINGKEKKYDDRGALFIALRNVAVNIFPNISFRSDNYIYNK